MPSAILIHQLFGHNKHGPKIWESGSMQPLAATDMGRKMGESCAPLGEGELGPHLTQCGQGRGLPACQVSS